MSSPTSQPFLPSLAVSRRVTVWTCQPTSGNKLRRDGYAARQWRLGRALAALALGIGCALYTGVWSLGFTAGARSNLISEHTAAIEEHGDRRAVAEAARADLATLASVKTANRAVVECAR